MTDQEQIIADFLALCEERGITVERKPDDTGLSVGGSLYLSGCTALTALPDGLTIKGWLYLSGCTALTALPDGLTVWGWLDLSGCTALPACRDDSGIGAIHAPDIVGEQTWCGRKVRLRTIDGFTMEVLSERRRGDVTILRCRYFGGGDLDELKPCFVAQQGDYSAHGETIDKALRDLRFKVMEHDFDEAELVTEIRARGTVLIEDFRLITGACEEGVRHGMEQAGLDRDADELPLDTVLGAAFGPYGERFKACFAGQEA